MKRSSVSVRRIVEPSLKESVQGALSPLTAWRKVIAILGVAVMFVGAVWFKLAFSLAGLGLALLTLVAGILLFSLAYAGIENHQVVKQNGG